MPRHRFINGHDPSTSQAPPARAVRPWAVGSRLVARNATAVHSKAVQLGTPGIPGHVVAAAAVERVRQLLLHSARGRNKKSRDLQRTPRQEAVPGAW